MLNVLLLETKSAIPPHTATSEVVVFFNPSTIERFYDEQANDLELVVMKVGNDTF